MIGLEKVETHFIFYLDPCSYDASKALKFWITVINCAINHAIDFDICFGTFKWFRKTLYFSTRSMKLLNFWKPFFWFANLTDIQFMV